MPHNNPQQTRRCIARTRSGNQCKNTINCSHHRCKDRGCAEEISHTQRDIPLTPLSIRQEYLASARSWTTNTSRSPNGSCQRDTSIVPPSPLFPANSVRIPEIDETEDDNQEQVSGSGHAQPSFIKHENLDFDAQGTSVKPPLIRNKGIRVRDGEYDIAGPEFTPLLDSLIDDGLLGIPCLDPSLPVANAEVGVTAKGKEKERGYSNGRDYNERDYNERDYNERDYNERDYNERDYNERDYNNIESHASTSVANVRDTVPNLRIANPEAYMTVKGKEKERRHSDWEYYTGFPASTSVAVRKAVIAAQVATPNADIDKFQYTRIVTSEASFDQIKSAETQENILDEKHYHSEPSPTSLPSSQTPTQSSTPDPDQSSSTAPEMIQSEDTVRQSLTPLSYNSEPVEPHSSTTFTDFLSHSAFNPDPDRVSSPAHEITRLADADHGIDVAKMDVAEYIRNRAKWANSPDKRALVAAFEAAVMGW